jgi:hypothetical protein
MQPNLIPPLGSFASAVPHAAYHSLGVKTSQSGVTKGNKGIGGVEDNRHGELVECRNDQA